MTAPATLWSFRGLLVNLVRRDLKSKYKRSLLGWLWSLASPAASLGVFTLVFSVFLPQQAPVAGNGTLQNFALFLFAGLAVWNTFSNSLRSAMGGFVGAGPLLTKIWFPPELPALAASASVLLQSAIEFSILMGIMVLVGNASWTFLALPLLVVTISAFAIGIGMLLSLWAVRYRDVDYVVTILLQLLFYGTPIVYRLDIVQGKKLWGWFPVSRVLEANPITQFVEASRDLTYRLIWPSPGRTIYLLVISALSLLVGSWLFSRRAPLIIEEL